MNITKITQKLNLMDHYRLESIYNPLHARILSLSFENKTNMSRNSSHWQNQLKILNKNLMIINLKPTIFGFKLRNKRKVRQILALLKHGSSSI